tara:strand:- start:267 stop:515 length:249 start_codon:yes stop_codon:yes gene_type:complete
MLNNKKYVIFNVEEIEKVNFAQVFENSSETLRKNNDETQAFVKYQSEMPSSIQNLTTKSQEYSHSEILEILRGEDWTKESDI